VKIAVIPARGGSRRIPHKNTRTFRGKPIIAYSIETAKASTLFAAVYVSTDDQRTADIAQHYGAIALHRPAEISGDETGTQEVMQWHLNNDLMLPGLTHACCIYATAPFMTVASLRLGHDAVLPGAGGFSYALAVNIDPLFDAGQFYWGWAQAFRMGAPLIGYYTRMVPVEADRVCDINTEDDWLRCERMYEALHP
jgi:N-acylneuraminate cytidylyltransferase